MYDSKSDTMIHIQSVRNLLQVLIDKINNRSKDHDASKLQSPEKEIYDKYIPLLKETNFGSDLYKKYISEMNIAFDGHHYKNNRHHPEYHADGINGMTLIDLIEMLADWRASSLRNKNGGDIIKSIEINKKRFNISDQLTQILINTINEIK